MAIFNSYVSLPEGNTDTALIDGEGEACGNSPGYGRGSRAGDGPWTHDET
jgi:hypothetical protein